MSFQLRTSKGLIGIAAALLMIGASAAANETQPLSLEGTWIMTSAYEILADGTRTKFASWSFKRASRAPLSSRQIFSAKKVRIK